MEYIWLSDTHLNFLTKSDLIHFILELEAKQVDGIFLTGDISTGPHIIHHLLYLKKITQIPIYFVLGNHDYYRSSIREVRASVHDLCSHNTNLFYLSKSEPISLTSEIALIGHDGWYDARWREPKTSLIFLWDWFNIKDFRSLFDNTERMDLLHALAEEATYSIEIALEKALKTHSIVYMLTHFPPWPEPESSLFGLVEKFWAPYNSCKIMANMLEKIMKAHPTKKLIVLSGHTHKESNLQITENIELKVARADFGRPIIQEIISL